MGSGKLFGGPPNFCGLYKHKDNILVNSVSYSSLLPIYSLYSEKATKVIQRARWFHPRENFKVLMRILSLAASAA